MERQPRFITMKPGPAFLRRRDGASAVEFAIVLPLLLILVFGIIEFSIALYDKAVITNASREGARAGILWDINPRTLQSITNIVTARVNDYCSGRLITFGSSNTATIQVSIDQTAGGDPSKIDSGDLLTVTVDYNYGFLVIPNFITSITGPLQLRATTIMRLE
ncbi:MAG: TadE/TadG family type IV pilus assembly protein [Desulfosoma sp.]